MTHKLKGVRAKKYAYCVNKFRENFGKHEYDVKLWRHKQSSPNANYHHMLLNENPPHENFLPTPLLPLGNDKRYLGDFVAPVLYVKAI